MKLARFVTALVCISALFSTANARSETVTFTARLSPLPVDFRSAETITGLGQVEASLEGLSLALSGDFAGLQGPATFARLHRGSLAIPGPAFADLKISRASSGELSGTVVLTAEQLQALQARAIYVQIYSEAAPGGNLRGWLFPVAAN